MESATLYEQWELVSVDNVDLYEVNYFLWKAVQLPMKR